jgi:hypothetical protein
MAARYRFRAFRRAFGKADWGASDARYHLARFLHAPCSGR